jgi:hypothetical protein
MSEERRQDIGRLFSELRTKLEYFIQNRYLYGEIQDTHLPKGVWYSIQDIPRMIEEEESWAIVFPRYYEFISDVLKFATHLRTQVIPHLGQDMKELLSRLNDREQALAKLTREYLEPNMIAMRDTTGELYRLLNEIDHEVHG